ncbi:tRNA(Phe) (4-demethylwyosine(37)-C(7)) aminocarboxypropyltransferase [Natronomonas pharaonis DSM 2160]|uniref:tRNA(Phe) (4-demethylwyosine(37)-C(7)) aminocarboxypropyltransferase n=1 Tax=Natronomonas pharaonis (strain ATCC 35678 / DSM 2160 / CIP 103997 / JCM 8858 / NBRC 14720 / NCIMB 2260 / Gabara) TaxID=348780 RepID=Q3ISW4_NATPD|nr:class I SAM-dependent methyltransferase family protein [Natronomonas pharaonis]CAI48771.1 tRNA(Phe) (4-demethylwyosine(37)-C(7)) aminocarboxypropyltransferase [Natronomonas pharaonis DSM 2160]
MTDGSADADLAAIVEKPQTQTVIEALRNEGRYDPSRRIEAHGDDHVAVPVSAPPTDTAVERVEHVELPPRSRDLADLLAAHGVDAATIEAAPSSWAVIGSIILVDFGDVSAPETLDADERTLVAETLLELHANADTVLARGGVSGRCRDPDVAVVAGIGDTETVHVEHGTKYAIDFESTMFSPGNKAERARMGEVVTPGERVFDMFAGIGYFTLPMARSGATVTAAEIDPDAYRLLVENLQLNGVSDAVRPVLGDCRDVATTADRVVMGYYDAHEYLDAALSALAPDGVVHLHEATPEPAFPARPRDRLTEAAGAAGRTVEILATRTVKSHSAGVVHGVVDARVH